MCSIRFCYWYSTLVYIELPLYNCFHHPKCKEMFFSVARFSRMNNKLPMNDVKNKPCLLLLQEFQNSHFCQSVLILIKFTWLHWTVVVPFNSFPSCNSLFLLFLEQLRWISSTDEFTKWCVLLVLWWFLIF